MDEIREEDQEQEEMTDEMELEYLKVLESL
jgi:hypothetical protein